MRRWCLLALITSGCFGGHGYGRHCAPGPLAAIEAVAGLAEATLEIASAVSEVDALLTPAAPPPPPVYPPAPPALIGSVLWDGFPGQGVSSVALVLQGNGLTVRTLADEDGNFQLPHPLPQGRYVLFIDDADIEGAVYVTVASGGPDTLVVPARLRVPQ
jgi:hypothetical protein